MMMASNRNERLNRSLAPEVIGGSDPVAEYDKREAGGTIGVVAGMLIALPSEAWHNVLPEVGQQAIIFGGTAVAIGGLWQISQAVRLREYSERKSELLREAVDNLPPPVGSIKDSRRWLD